MVLTPQHQADVSECADIVAELHGDTCRAILNNVLTHTALYQDSEQTKSLFVSIRNHHKAEPQMLSTLSQSKQ